MTTVLFYFKNKNLNDEIRSFLNFQQTSITFQRSFSVSQELLAYDRNFFARKNRQIFYLDRIE